MTRPSISVQLYSVRDLLANDTTSTLDRLAAMGLRRVEPFGLPNGADALRRALDSCGMTAPSAHASLLARVDESLDAARRLGTVTLIEPYQDPRRFADREAVQTIADELSAAARRAGELGVEIAYHNHDAELRQRVDGVPALLVLAELTDERVRFELDAYWCAVAGEDPAAVARSLGERLVAIHVKDGDIGGGIGAQVPAGRGAVPLLDVLDAAPHARPVVEFDVLPAEGIDAIAASIDYLLAHGAEL